MKLPLSLLFLLTFFCRSSEAIPVSVIHYDIKMTHLVLVGDNHIPEIPKGKYGPIFSSFVVERLKSRKKVLTIVEADPDQHQFHTPPLFNLQFINNPFLKPWTSVRGYKNGPHFSVAFFVAQYTVEQLLKVHLRRNQQNS